MRSWESRHLSFRRRLMRPLAYVGVLIVVAALGVSCSTRLTRTDPDGIVHAEASTTAAPVIATTSSTPTTSAEDHEQPSTSTSHASTTTTSLPVEYSNGPLQISPDGNGQLDALRVGPIALRGNCVGFANGDEFTVIIWPSGTRWIDATSEVELADGTTVGIGHEVQLSGGFEQILYLDRYPIGGAAMKANVLRCNGVGPTDNVWYAGH
jgi:hypothetical protein